MKPLISKLPLFFLLFLLKQTAYLNAQVITSPGSYAPTNGGGRILSTQGNTAADPAIGFTGAATFPTSLNDAGGGNGIFRPLANTMAFSTSSAERMRITSGGFVGIGTNNPSQRLHLSGGNMRLDAASGTTAGSIILGSPTYSSQNGLRMYYTNTNQGMIDLRTASANNGLLFRVDQTNGTTERMRIAANGNVGVGISTPTHKMHIAGSAMISGPSPQGGAMLLLSDDVSSTAYPNGRWGIEYEPNQHGLNFWQPWNPSTGGGANWLMFLKDDGKVGIGIDPAGCSSSQPSFAPGYRLFVREGILTEKVKVANYCSSQWADYVFEETYHLKPLSEVEKYIQENKHLPGIPSAAEIEKDGLDLAEMLSRQMAKIEELTLHSIELSKRLEKLEAENERLKKQSSEQR